MNLDFFGPGYCLLIIAAWCLINCHQWSKTAAALWAVKGPPNTWKSKIRPRADSQMDTDQAQIQIHFTFNFCTAIYLKSSPFRPVFNGLSLMLGKHKFCFCAMTCTSSSCISSWAPIKCTSHILVSHQNCPKKFLSQFLMGCHWCGQRINFACGPWLAILRPMKPNTSDETTT